LSPCGRCRQLLHEVGGPELLVDSPDGPLTLASLLPNAFGPDDVARRGSDRVGPDDLARRRTGPSEGP
jgi:cytidine deaminase